jgi:hypothetical protein
VSDTGFVGEVTTTHPRPLASCCPSHQDWATLAQHLVVENADFDARRVVDTVRRARDAIELAALTGAEALATGEMIARYQLLLLSAGATEAARLDPERHDRSRAAHRP